MKINNANEFFQFARSNGLARLTPEITALVICMEEYGRLCPCDPNSVKIDKYNQCKSFYVTFAKKSHSVANQLLSKVADETIVLCIDGQHLTTITR